MGYPYPIQMYDDGKHDDGFAGDGVFGTDLVKVGVHDTRKDIISVSTKDIAGNFNKTQTLALFDNEPPRVENILPHYLFGKNSVRDGDIAYVSAKVLDTGTVSGILDAFLEPSPVCPRVRMLDDGKGNDPAANDGIYTSSNFTVPLGAPNGKNSLTVSGLDGSFQLTLGYGSLLVDNPPPSVRVMAPLEGAYDGTARQRHRREVLHHPRALGGWRPMEQDGADPEQAMELLVDDRHCQADGRKAQRQHKDHRLQREPRHQGFEFHERRHTTRRDSPVPEGRLGAQREPHFKGVGVR
jgi:hypothetical protein